MTDFIKISGADIKENHWTYTPAKGLTIIYIHKCKVPGTDEIYNYIGSTDGSIKDRCGRDWLGYIYGVTTKSKLASFILKYGYKNITSRIMWVVSDEIRAQVEQEEIERYDATNIGFNSIRAVKEQLNPPKKYTTVDKSAKNKPIEVSVENLQVVIPHKCTIDDTAQINKGFYQKYFKDKALSIHTPGMKGHIQVTGYKNTKEGLRYVLQYLERDLGKDLRFGPDGCHSITLDNIYLTKTKTNLRTFLDQNPQYLKRVPYLTFGTWD